MYILCACANILLTLIFLPTPNFNWHLYFVNANICWRLTFVDAYILLMPIFVDANICRPQCFVDVNILLTLIFIGFIINDCVVYISWLLLICLNLLRFPRLDTCRSLFWAQGYIWPHLYCVYPCCVSESSRVTARWRLLVRERVEDLGSAGGLTKWPHFFWPEPNKCSHQINVIHLSCRLQLIVWYPLIVVPLVA